MTPEEIRKTELDKIRRAEADMAETVARIRARADAEPDPVEADKFRAAADSFEKGSRMQAEALRGLHDSIERAHALARELRPPKTRWWVVLGVPAALLLALYLFGLAVG